MSTAKGSSQSVSTAEFTETPRLVLEQATGDIFIEAWDQPTIEVATDDEGDEFELVVNGSQVTIQAMNPASRKDYNWEEFAPDLRGLGVDLEKVASRVRRSVERSVRLRHTGRAFDFNINLGRWTGSRDYRVHVPYNCNLTLRTSSGDLRVNAVNGTHLIQTTSGDVRLRDLHGNVLFATASGDVYIESLEGRLGFKSASGDLQIREGNLEELSAHTASGDVDVDLVRVPEREFDVRSTSGDVTLRLPGDARLTAEVGTFSGDIECDLPHSKVRNGRSRTLTINGGGTLARLGTTSGDISIEVRRGSHVPGDQSGEGHGDMTQPEGVSARRQAELDLLQAVERGEITSQEALRRLADLGR